MALFSRRSTSRESAAAAAEIQQIRQVQQEHADYEQHATARALEELQSSVETLSLFAQSVPPHLLVPGFECAELFRRMLLESERGLHKELPYSALYTFHTALSEYLPTTYRAYAALATSGAQADHQEQALLQSVTSLRDRFAQALEEVRESARFGRELHLETHIDFMHARMSI
ncbi:MAG: hypothetical protein Q4P78_08250 [Rothia sp. (in: high G+C Gram-positive bacteria)]|uniref:hypothetical protein n=1 Tax=Rothia sp. (in: high G+C Gram-positive bacteria) TaxID=1885016 RepID=UPI0026DF74CB|nr:hypothetical protein [Rothia sp. (in: high G+C Gram-positive bacteria)]MDO5751167.1 hypothetical protein [Rothia sp. (in: high G+C Gram-positive bacteria)]